MARRLMLAATAVALATAYAVWQHGFAVLAPIYIVCGYVTWPWC